MLTMSFELERGGGKTSGCSENSKELAKINHRLPLVAFIPMWSSLILLLMTDLFCGHQTKIFNTFKNSFEKPYTMEGLL